VPLTGDKKSSKQKKISEVVAIDLATTGMKLVRAKRGKDGPVITAVDVLPPIDLAPLVEETDEEEEQEAVDCTLALSKAWTSYYAALSITAEDAAIRYVSLPSQIKDAEKLKSQLREHMGLDGDYRISHVVIPALERRAEMRLLAAAVPVSEVEHLLSYVESGYPAALSLEVSSLAALSGFRALGPIGEESEEEGAIAFIDSGARVSLMAVFNKGSLVLVRKFNVGGEALVKRLQQQMAVDREVASGILSDGSFDISQSVQGVMDSFLRQISISKEFIERREDCHIKTLYITGGMSLSEYWMEKIRGTVGVETLVWNPFDELEVVEGAYPEKLEGQEPRFAAAVGSIFGVFEES